jgi:hypothetical protein
MHAGIEIGRRHEALQRRADRGLMRAAEHGLGFAAGLQHIALRPEAVESHLRRVVGEEGVAARGGADAILDALGRLLRADAGIEPDAAIDPAPARHRGGPVAALDLADVQVDRMGLILEMLAPGLLGVELSSSLRSAAMTR